MQCANIHGRKERRTGRKERDAFSFLPEAGAFPAACDASCGDACNLCKACLFYGFCHRPLRRAGEGTARAGAQHKSGAGTDL